MTQKQSYRIKIVVNSDVSSDNREVNLGSKDVYIFPAELDETAGHVLRQWLADEGRRFRQAVTDTARTVVEHLTDSRLTAQDIIDSPAIKYSLPFGGPSYREVLEKNLGIEDAWRLPDRLENVRIEVKYDVYEDSRSITIGTILFQDEVAAVWAEAGRGGENLRLYVTSPDVYSQLCGYVRLELLKLEEDNFSITALDEPLFALENYYGKDMRGYFLGQKGD